MWNKFRVNIIKPTVTDQLESKSQKKMNMEEYSFVCATVTLSEGQGHSNWSQTVEFIHIYIFEQKSVMSEYKPAYSF